jgi:hypothetical protein
MGIDGSRARTLLAVLVIAACAAAVASAAPAKSSKTTRVTVNADYVQLNACGLGSPQYGHIEVVAYDDDPSFPVSSSEQQIDRVSITVTRADGSTWEQHPLGVDVIDGGSGIFVADGSWLTGWRLYDGGSPGTNETGAVDQGIPVTTDRMEYQGFTGCTSSRLYLTKGQIKISTAD